MARTTVHYVQVFARAEDDLRTYAVEERSAGVPVRSLGQVSGAGDSWIALPVGAPAWTGPFPTRAAGRALVLARTA